MLGPEGVAALLAAPLPALEELHFNNNKIGEGGAEAIAAASQRLPKLRVLQIKNDSLPDDFAPESWAVNFAREAIWARALGQGHFPHLESLSLCSANVGPEGAAALAAATHGCSRYRHEPLMT